MSRQTLFSRYRLLPFIVIVALIILATIRLMPGMVVSDPVVRIMVTHKGMSLPDGFFLYQQLTARGITIKSITPGPDSLVIHLENEEQQLAARRILSHILSAGYITA
ncbi:hypothetical protein GCM10009414_02130 [Tatumella terrea]|uniref:EnvZ/OmpR regulon moderator MzrA n=1 Tax=Tatumella terrea TaxID=419007 RepID=A0ABW1W2N0_9GAMM|nr:EnvZ/OmpR regulon moderator MzrA [Tatumella sp. JGM118]MBS0908934.1 EnvZ/OmpR regulon moderator MzrA [Tatumella sp. JGM118]